jgi:low molecular weight protein-tyrosine phosphatase
MAPDGCYSFGSDDVGEVWGRGTVRMIDIEMYGGKRGFLAHIRALILYTLGAYGGAEDVDWSSVTRLVFVCLGNICRSPYAEAKARSMGMASVSLGLSAENGVAANAAAVKNALVRGVDLSTHRATRMEPGCLLVGDLVIVFESWQISEVRRRLGPQARVKLLGIWSTPKRPHIHDPYGQDDRYFQQCFSIIDKGLAGLAERMRRAAALAGKTL